MKTTLAILLGIGFIAGAASPGRAATIVEYAMTGSSVTALETATTVDPGVTASLISPNSNTVTVTQVGTAPNEVLNVAMATGTPLSTLNENTTIAGGTYISFTVTPNTGETLSLTSLAFKASASNSSTPRAFYVFSTANGASTPATTLLTDNNGAGGTLGTSLTSYSIDLSGAQYQNLTGAVTFKFYVQTPTLFQSISFDDIALFGTATTAAVPEPAPTALLGLSAFACGAAVWMRRRAASAS
ncbi:MAG TPA: PEP-CTERM sorting domain-containing protein [Candidatus Methylacidiphilales bacterium]